MFVTQVFSINILVLNVLIHIERYIELFGFKSSLFLSSTMVVVVEKQIPRIRQISSGKANVPRIVKLYISKLSSFVVRI